MKIELIGEERDDGTLYFSSPGLPGFHFIMAKDENPMDAMIPALMEFLPLYLSAKLRDMPPVIRPARGGWFRNTKMMRLSLTV